MLPIHEIAREIAAQLQARFRVLGYSLDEALFRVTIEEVITVLVQRLTDHVTPPERLSQTDFDHLLDQASEYLNGECMPSRKSTPALAGGARVGTMWGEIISHGLAEAWSEQLKETV